ncbi:MAG: hypothetical protein Q7R95_11275 [bacterium]|nr:hypothetical protein [bacterium]
MNNVLDLKFGVIGEETNREVFDKSLKAFLSHALGNIYYDRMIQARQNGDKVAEEFWEIHAFKNMSHADKKRNFIK